MNAPSSLTALPTLIRGDARALPLPDGCVDLVVTSPPYFGLRDYGTDTQIGSEPTPGEFLDALITCTAEMARVLKPSGSIFVNLGDKYSGAAGPKSGSRTFTDGHQTGGRWPTVPRGRATAAPPKSLLLLPERYRIRAVDELGLIARAVLVWSKPNGLPESVTDRVRRSHEDWVHLTKSPRYFAAVDEIREPYLGQDGGKGEPYAGRVDSARSTLRSKDENPLGKLPGSVWEIATQPLRVPAELGVDHFAAFPMEWPRRLILGWSPREVCTVCGEGRRPTRGGAWFFKPPTYDQDRRALEIAAAAGWDAERVALYRKAGAANISNRTERLVGSGTAGVDARVIGKDLHDVFGGYSRFILGLLQQGGTGYACACPDTSAPSTPGVVLDPFSGTGTTSLVATMLGRRGIGVDLSADYQRLAQWRSGDPKERARAAGLDPDAVARVERVPAGQQDLFASLTNPEEAA